MTKISSFKIAAGILSIVALVKISVFVIAVAMLAFATPAQAGNLGKPCTDTTRDQWLSLEAMQSKVEALGYKITKVEKNACGELRLALEKMPSRL